MLPAWARPAPRAIEDCRRIAYALRGRAEYAAVDAIMDWVTSTDPTPDEAYTQMDACAPTPAGELARHTLAWLIGFQSFPPIRLPRRNADGAVMTADQLYDEYMRGKYGLPEEQRDARTRAEKDAALYRRLAERADSARPHDDEPRKTNG